MKRRSLLLFPAPALALALFACDAAEPDTLEPPPGLPTAGRTYVVNRIVLPESHAQAMAEAIDLDGDGVGDNSLASTIILAYDFLGRSGQPDLDEAVSSGEMMHLLLFGHSVEFAETVRVFLGEDTDGDPTNNFDPDSELAIRGDSPLESAAFGSWGSGDIDFGAGQITLENTLFGAVVLPLDGATIRAELQPDGSITGDIGGTISANNIDEQLVPALVDSVLADVAADCSAPACCVEGSRGAAWMALFDDDEDCRLSASDVADDGITEVLFSPDLDRDGDGIVDGLSASFRFTAVPTRFALP